MKIRLKYILLVVMVLSVFACIRSTVAAETTETVYETARPSINGHLHVQGNVLADENNREVQLRGVSTHGLTWYPEYINDDFFADISSDWNCNMIRLAMYSEIYCENPEESLSLMKKGIDAAIKADMYVLVDWHILNDYDPNMNKAQAAEFFDLISKEYAEYPNLIFEICNEPNGETDWSYVLRYSNEIIPVIRKNMPEACIVIGTPEYDRNLASAVIRPLEFDNVLYVLHFYCATHNEGLRGELEAAVEAGLPVFISECGISEASGDGDIDFPQAVEWFTYLKEHNISYAVWSLSDKDETSAFFNPGFVPNHVPLDSELTLCGKWIRELIRGADPASIPVTNESYVKGKWERFRSWLSDSLGNQGYRAVNKWIFLFGISALSGLLCMLVRIFLLRRGGNGKKTYDSIYKEEDRTTRKGNSLLLAGIILFISICCTIAYLLWRILFSVPYQAGIIACTGNILLLFVEIIGFAETLVLYDNLLGMKNHPLPEIKEEEYPDVDIFIATYNEPVDLLRKTVNGCKHLKYPDTEKVHIWVCDDNHREEMKQMAQEMGVGYFDREDHEGAKAGNLNHALSLTKAPYIVTFDADMIPRSDFLLKTIPYFVDVENRNSGVPDKEQIHLGLLQTPQCFYDPDVFQYALYSEKRAPNEQDFFYRTIEAAKTSSNSVIYGGSNTVLSRRALQDIGGFYTKSITEDFATGLLIEAAGYVSLGLSEPLASGQTPNTYTDHIKQRIRWGRGVIATAKQLKIFQNKNLNPAQKISYWSSVSYWYSPLKNLIYMLSPLLYAALAIPVFRCSWPELIVYWLPMYIMQDLCLKILSNHTISLKWSGIYETSVMPHLLMPVIQESFGKTMSTFKVTDKSAKNGKRVVDMRLMRPFLILIVLSVIGIIRIFYIMNTQRLISLLILLFWVVRNLYYLIMAVFLVDGRDSDHEVVRVTDAENVIVEVAHGEDKGKIYEGITVLMTEHKVRVYLDEGDDLKNGTSVKLKIENKEYPVELEGTITNVHLSRHGNVSTHEIEILDFKACKEAYLQLLYDRIPTLPQELHNDFGIFMHLWQNIAHRVARTRL